MTLGNGKLRFKAVNIRCFIVPVLLVAGFQLHAQTTWHDRLNRAMPLLGHHNWIVLADPAYPFPSSPSIELAATDMSQTDLVKSVLDALTKAPHLRPIFYTDSELPYVAEEDANGISAFRAELGGLLKLYQVKSMPHEQLLSNIYTVSNTYHVLVLKSTTRLPYSSVYIELETGYWTPEAEKRLRAAMAK